ncbi:uncharacterized protein LOC117113336 [Anneissia japonica]|uniref:uncharacterized protein LOC117113336 n=2 Tax=Anneissia japonica TaxID=1529436 RepID=UPI001425666C|nr:uncharacterized protein LOC117113336 [Anneissia japonica]
MSTVAAPCAVFMGNLNNVRRKCEVCSMIVYVFNDVLGINITKDNVNISSSYHCNCFTATIFVPNEIYQKLAVQTLNQSMLPSGLIKEGRKLRIDYFRAGHEKQNVGTVLTSAAEINNQNFNDEIKMINYKKKRRRKKKRTDGQGNTSLVQSPVINSASQGINKHQSTSNEEELSEGIKTDASNNANLLELHNNADSIADQLDNVDYLKKNQQLGNETRKLEFKRGGGSYLKNILKTDVGTYMSAFLNSSGGTLLIGVDDEGFVQGISLDHKAEDKVRRDIDGVMRRIEPAVLPNIYSVSFIPVQDKIQCNLKVIKITVGAVKTKMLYESPGGGVFIRRDGSIQGPLKTKDLQELCHMKLEEEFERKEADLKKQIKILECQLEDASLGHNSTSSVHSANGNRKSTVCVVI